MVGINRFRFNLRDLTTLFPAHPCACPPRLSPPPHQAGSRPGRDCRCNADLRLATASPPSISPSPHQAVTSLGRDRSRQHRLPPGTRGRVRRCPPVLLLRRLRSAGGCRGTGGGSWWFRSRCRGAGASHLDQPLLGHLPVCVARELCTAGMRGESWGVLVLQVGDVRGVRAFRPLLLLV